MKVGKWSCRVCDGVQPDNVSKEELRRADVEKHGRSSNILVELKSVCLRF